MTINKQRYFLILACGALIVMLAMGTRQAFGLFLKPISVELEIGRESFAFAMALQNLLFGIVQPFVGAFADKLGPVKVMIAGAALYVLGLYLAMSSTSTVGLTWTLGILVGLALSGTTYVVVLGAVGRLVSPEQRAGAFAIISAAGSFGMFIAIPGAQEMLAQWGWRGALGGMAFAVAMIALLAIGLKAREGQLVIVQQSLSIQNAIQQASRHSGYWLLVLGFSVCGFHIAFIYVHLTSYLSDVGVDSTSAIHALSLIGLFNVFGSYLFGRMGGIYRKKYLLAWIYWARAVVIGVFFMVPATGTSALIFGAAIGFLWLATVPLTSGLVAQLFGTQYLSMLYGFVFFGHQIGSFFGAWLGGRMFDLTGSYDAVWWASIALAILAGFIHFVLSDAQPKSAQTEAQPA